MIKITSDSMPVGNALTILPSATTVPLLRVNATELAGGGGPNGVAAEVDLTAPSERVYMPQTYTGVA